MHQQQNKQKAKKPKHLLLRALTAFFFLTQQIYFAAPLSFASYHDWHEAAELLHQEGPAIHIYDAIVEETPEMELDSNTIDFLSESPLSENTEETTEPSEFVYQPASTLQEALESGEIREGYASAVVLDRALSHSDLEALREIDFEIAVAVMFGKVVAFSSGEHGEIQTTSNAYRMIKENATFLMHNHPDSFDGPSSTDLVRALPDPAIEFVIDPNAIHAYNQNGVLSTLGETKLLETMLEAIGSEAPDETAARAALNEFVYEHDRFETAHELEKVTFRGADEEITPLNSKFVYANFHGVSFDSWGYYSDVTLGAYDRDGNVNNFSNSELDSISEIMNRLKEQFSPFNLEFFSSFDYLADEITFSSANSMEVVIGSGSSSFLGGAAGGVAYLDTWKGNNSWVHSVLTFEDNLGNGNAKYVVDAAAHEIGHGLGLYHSSDYDSSGNLLTEYHTGSSDGYVAPVMGVGYYSDYQLWSHGPSYSFTTIQDDLDRIAGAYNEIGYRLDDHGAGTLNASTFETLSSTTLSSQGIIEEIDDVDTFSFTIVDGTVDFDISAPSYGMLNPKVEIFDENGSLVAVRDSLGRTESFSLDLLAGTYYVAVSSHGTSLYDPEMNAYGYHLGQYTVNLTVPQGSNNERPSFNTISNQTVDEEFELSFNVSATDPEGDSLTYSAQNLPEGATFDAATQTFTWTPTYSQSGTYDVTFVASDGTSSAQQVVTITVNNTISYNVNTGGDLTAVAYNLDQTLQLQFTGNYYLNSFGYQEKWLVSDAEGKWYALLPNGELHVYESKTTFDSTTLVETLDSSFWDDPSLLYNAQPPTNTENQVPQIDSLTHNGVDRDSTAANLQVYSTDTVTYSATISDPDGDTLNWEWIYQVNGGSEVVFSSGSGTPSSAVFDYSGATEGDVYTWMMRVRDASIIREQSLQTEIILEADTTLPVVSNVSVSNVTETSATFNWVTDEASGSAVQICLSDYTNCAMSSLDQTFVTDHQITMNNLAPGTDYVYRVYSWDATNNTTISDYASFTTNAAQDNTAPLLSSISVSALSDTSFEISWSTDEAATSQLEICNKSGKACSIVASSTSLETNHFLQVTGLRALTTYQYRVISRDAAGNLGTSTKQSITTLDTPDTTAPQITNVATSNIDENSADISWTTNEVSTTQVELCDGNGANCSMTTLDSTLVTSHQVSLTGLTASTAYQYRVYSTDVSGNTQISNFASFTTLAPPNQPPSVTTIGYQGSDQDPNTSGIQLYNEGTLQLIGRVNDPEGDDLSWQWFYTIDGGAEQIFQSGTGTICDTTLDMTTASVGTAYRLTLRVSDGNEVAERGTTFHVIARPDTTAPQITSITTSNITEASATVTWTTDEDATTQLELCDTNQSNCTLTTLDQTLSTSHQVDLTALDAGTTYTYRVRSTDNAGNAQVSNFSSFNTDEVVITNNDDSSNNNDSSTNNDSTDPLAQKAYDLDQQLGLEFVNSYYQNVFGHNEKWMLARTTSTWHVVLPNGELHVYTGATYFDSSSLVEVFDSNYWEDPTLLHDAQEPVNNNNDTSNDTTPPQVSNLSATSITQTSATVSWNTDEDSTTQAEVCDSNFSNCSLTMLKSILSQTHSVDLSGLTANTNYVVRVRSIDNAGNFGVSSWINFSTLAVPNQPPVIDIYNAAATDRDNAQSGLQLYQTDSVTLSASASDANADTLSWQWVYTLNGGSENVALSGTGAITNHTFNATAQPGSYYDWKLKVSDGTETVEVSFTRMEVITTPDTTAPQISNVATSNITETSSTVTWTTDESATTQLELCDANQSNCTLTTLDQTLSTSHQVDLTALDAGTTYTYRVRSTDNAGNTQVSNFSSFATDEVVITNNDDSSNNNDTSTNNDSTDPLAQKAYNLDQALDLNFTGNYYQNVFGHNEKWLLATAESTWYVVLPNGEFHRYNGSFSFDGGTLVDTFDTSYWEDPAKLFNAENPETL